MRSILTILTLITLCAAVVQAREEKPVQGPLVTREEFFAQLDCSLPGLAAVGKAIASNDFAAASTGLLDYMRTRRSPKYFTNWWDKPAEKQSSYDTTRADDICGHLFHGMLVDWYPPYRMGVKIDWAANPYNDREWHWGLNRHDQWVILGQAYWATRDEEYAREFVSQFTDWITTRPVVTDGKHNSSASWRTIEAGIRMSSSWPRCYQHFVTSPSFTPEANLLYLMSVVDHARHLMKNPTGVNWLTMEMNGLLHAGVLFPEFSESVRWREFALERLAKELGAQVYPDGTQIELTTGYHQVALGNFAGPLKLCELNGVSVPASYQKDLERLYAALVHLTKPSGFLPALNDSDAAIESIPDTGRWADSRRALKEGSARFSRADMLYVATDGAQDKKPPHTSHAFPYAGLYVMRQDWIPNSLYLIFDAGPLGAAHQHEDKLSFEAYAFGETLLYDCGRYSYSDRVYGPYMRSSLAHNTALVDGRGQARRSQTAGDRKWVVKEPLDNPWVSEPGFDYAEGVYDDGYGPELDKTVTHRRRVLFVKSEYWLILDRFEGAGKHTINTLFHFAPGKAVSDPATLACTTSNDGRPNLLIAPAATAGVSVSIVEGRESPCQGWVSTQYNDRRAAPVADYAFTGELPVGQAYLLRPAKSSQPSVGSIRRLSLTVDGCAPDTRACAYAVELGEGTTDLVLLAHGVPGEKRFGGFATDAQIAVIRTDRSGSAVRTSTWGEMRAVPD